MQTVSPEWVATDPTSAVELADARATIIDLLGPSPTEVDDLLRRCQFCAAAVMTVLLELELAGRVETLPGNRVALIRLQGD
jgi:DNA processing protein